MDPEPDFMAKPVAKTPEIVVPAELNMETSGHSCKYSG
jgi:cell division protein FtsZ